MVNLKRATIYFSIVIFSLLIPLFVNAQVPGDFKINCQLCGKSGNDVLNCNNKFTAPYVDFSWTAAAGAERYEVYYKNYSIGNWIGPIKTTTGTSYRASVPLDSQNHYYVKAINASGFKSCSITNAAAGGCKAPNINYKNSDEGAEANCEIPSSSPPPPPPPPPGLPPPPPPPPAPPPSPAPIISNVKIINITQNGATVVWNTDQASDSQVEYCTTSSRCGINSAINTGLTANHSVVLSGLIPNTYYYVWAKSRNGDGSLGILGYFLFRTLSPSGSITPVPSTPPASSPPPASGDKTPPVISNIQITNITRDSAVISWETDEPATSQVSSCIIIFCFSSLVSDSNLITNHSFTVTGLRADRNIYIRIGANDASGNRGTSDIVSFRTQPGLVISNIRATNITQTSMTIQWDTNYPSDSRVITCYVIFFCYFSRPVTDPTVVSSHSITVNNLRPNTLYYYQVTSYDPLGYSARSSYVSARTL